MLNYKDKNLTNVPANEVPIGTMAMKIGNNVFIAGTINNYDYGVPYVVVDDNGVLKAKKLQFEDFEKQPYISSDSENSSDFEEELETIQNIKIFNTGMPEPKYKSKVRAGGGGMSDIDVFDWSIILNN